MTDSLTHANSPLEQLRRRRTLAAPAGASHLSPRDRNDLAELLSEPTDPVMDPSFDQKDAEKALFDDAPAIPEPNTSWYHPVMESASNIRDVRGVVNVVLNKHQEQALFLQFNYARYRVMKLREKIGDKPVTDAQARQLLHWYRLSRTLRDRIAQFNLALVLAMAKRVRGADLDFADLISEGNMALLRATDKFNASKGFKFSTYACRAILKAFSRTGIKQSQYKSMFPTDFDPALEKSDHQERKAGEYEDDCASQVRRIFERNDAELSDVEQAVIEHRFALGSSVESAPLTLEQVGKLVGLTKERVRQIQNKALVKLRTTLEESYIDGPAAQTPADESAELATAAHDPSI
jgi:RNA polymerase primary sigma factor